MEWYGFSVICPKPHRGSSKRNNKRKREDSKESVELKDIEGLTAEDTVTCAQTEDTEGTDEIIVPLLHMKVWNTAGTTVAPANRDLPCLLNGEPLVSEVNLIPGSMIEVGDKQLEFSDSPTPRPRRHLPPTPGVPVLPQPPPKPQRASASSVTEEPVNNVRPPERKPPPLPSDWAVIELPSSDAELLEQTHKPEQLASMAAGYVTKHIQMHTDARVSAELTDQIFRAMQEVASHGRDILIKFLKDLIEHHTNRSTEADRSPEPSHEAVIMLLRDILRQFLDPQSLVVVSLQLLRALSHVTGAPRTLVACQVTSAILGTMAALKSAATVQQYCLDVLAKIALYHPSISEKAPMRESAIDLICLTLAAHSTSLTIAQAGCRALANLAQTLYTITSNSLDSGLVASEELHQFVSLLIAVLEYMYTKCLMPIQNVLKAHGTDLTIKTDGRRFLFIYAKLEQLRQRKQQWLLASPTSRRSPFPPPLSPHQPNGHSEEDGGDTAGKGIMKRSRSFENLRTPERKVMFDEDAGPESCTPSSSPSPTHCQDESLEEGDSTIQVLSRTSLPPLPKRCPINPSSEKPSTDLPVMGNRPEAEGTDSPFNQSVAYENWDLLRNLLQSRANLDGHSYSAPDIHFLRLLVKTQVVALVCALAVDGKDRQAVDLMEKPLSEIMRSKEVPPGLQQFVTRQYQQDTTLMDMDPGLLVSVIDAVRYKSLSFEMAQKSVLSVVKALDNGQSVRVVDVTVEFLAATILNRPLAPAMTVSLFVDQVCAELERASKSSKNASALRSLLSEIRTCSHKTPRM